MGALTIYQQKPKLQHGILISHLKTLNPFQDGQKYFPRFVLQT